MHQNDIIFYDLPQLFPLKKSPEWFGCDGYYIPRGNLTHFSNIFLNFSLKFLLYLLGDLPEELVPEFSFDAPTTKQNLVRLLRCMQIENRAILLEGSPGVGKTSLIQAVSKASGHSLTRINLSEQTDVSDLFGADLPTDGGDSGSFEWRDGPFLRALKEGNWILLDEVR